MGARRLLDHDAATGITEYYHGDDVGGFTIETTQDVTNLVETNRFLRNNTSGFKNDLVQVASIPNVVLMDLAAKGILTHAGKILDDKKYRAWLNDSENQAFRTRPGRV